MKKYFLKNGKEVTLGEDITETSTIKIGYRTVTITTNFKVTEENLEDLIDKGVIYVRDFSEELKPMLPPMDLDAYIIGMAERMNMCPHDLYDFLNTLDDIYPAAAFSIVLREIAVILDKFYPDHIKNSEEIYVISLLDGRIHKINKASIKSYENFAAFRSLKDAKTACKITKNILKDLFTSGKQKD